jgi:hypothetical protein
VLRALIVVAPRVGEKIPNDKIRPHAEESIGRDVKRNLVAVLVVNGEHEVDNLEELAGPGAKTLVRRLEIISISAVCITAVPVVKAVEPPSSMGMAYFSLTISTNVRIPIESIKPISRKESPLENLPSSSPKRKLSTTKARISCAASCMLIFL